jgi:CTP-dependent riboflavin kinase
MGGARKLTGVVFSDLGRAASFMAVEGVAAAMRAALGFGAYPGTLNVRLDTPEARAVWSRVREGDGIPIAAGGGFCAARCFPTLIEGNWPGAVILPEVADYPADKLEIVAPVRLKDALKLADGAQLTLEFVD